MTAFIADTCRGGQPAAPHRRHRRSVDAEYLNISQRGERQVSPFINRAQANAVLEPWFGASVIDGPLTPPYNESETGFQTDYLS
jgi:hypothetical protein